MAQLPLNVRELLHNMAGNRIEFMQLCTFGVGYIGVQGRRTNGARSGPWRISAIHVESL
jgi:hypothetical protein